MDRLVNFSSKKEAINAYGVDSLKRIVIGVQGGMEERLIIHLLYNLYIDVASYGEILMEASLIKTETSDHRIGRMRDGQYGFLVYDTDLNEFVFVLENKDAKYVTNDYLDIKRLRGISVERRLNSLASSVGEFILALITKGLNGVKGDLENVVSTIYDDKDIVAAVETRNSSRLAVLFNRWFFNHYKVSKNGKGKWVNASSKKSNDEDGFGERTDLKEFVKKTNDKNKNNKKDISACGLASSSTHDTIRIMENREVEHAMTHLIDLEPVRERFLGGLKYEPYGKTRELTEGVGMHNGTVYGRDGRGRKHIYIISAAGWDEVTDDFLFVELVSTKDGKKIYTTTCSLLNAFNWLDDDTPVGKVKKEEMPIEEKRAKCVLRNMDESEMHDALNFLGDNPDLTAMEVSSTGIAYVPFTCADEVRDAVEKHGIKVFDKNITDAKYSIVAVGENEKTKGFVVLTLLPNDSSSVDHKTVITSPSALRWFCWENDGSPLGIVGVKSVDENKSKILTGYQCLGKAKEVPETKEVKVEKELPEGFEEEMDWDDIIEEARKKDTIVKGEEQTMYEYMELASHYIYREYGRYLDSFDDDDDDDALSFVDWTNTEEGVKAFRKFTSLGLHNAACVFDMIVIMAF